MRKNLLECIRRRRSCLSMRSTDSIKHKDVYKRQELIEKLGIDKKDTYAFGDADNDVEMMQAVGTGIAMGRHSEKVGEVASMVTGTVKEEGITMALKKLGLI